MRLLLSSDWHGVLPELPPHDILVHAGDLFPHFTKNPCRQGTEEGQAQKEWFFSTFKNYIKSLGNKETIICAGNHDFWSKPYNDDDSLQFQGCGIDGYTNSWESRGIKWGVMPYSLQVGDWVFGKSESGLEEEFRKLPSGLDILITHAPGKHLGDMNNWGSYALLHFIEVKKPKYVVCGHIHDAYGIYSYYDTKLINCSLLNDNYKVAHKPIMLETETKISIVET